MSSFYDLDETALKRQTYENLKRALILNNENFEVLKTYKVVYKQDNKPTGHCIIFLRLSKPEKIKVIFYPFIERKGLVRYHNENLKIRHYDTKLKNKEEITYNYARGVTKEICDRSFQGIFPTLSELGNVRSQDFKSTATKPKITCPIARSQ